MVEGLIISVIAGIVCLLIADSIWGKSFSRFVLSKLRQQPTDALDLSSHRDVKNYLEDLQKKMQAYNAGWSDGFGQAYIELEAVEKAPDTRDQQISRERGDIINMPRIFPKISELSDPTDSLPQGLEVSSSRGLQTRRVRNILRELRNNTQPIVLLGEPGSGKSTTLRELTIELAKKALRRPGEPIPIYVELGKFQADLGEEPFSAIIQLIKSAVPPGVPSLRDQIQAEKIGIPLVVVFDAMDEMPRKGDYSQGLKALADFALEYILQVKTVFACRINDFDSNFGHRQFVLEPFNSYRIKKFIRLSLGRKILLEGKVETPASIATRLLQADELGKDARNPLTLSMAVRYMQQEGNWPKGRIPLFQNHVVTLAQIAYLRTMHPAYEKAKDQTLLITHLVDQWAHLAYEIFKSDASVYSDIQTLKAGVGEEALALAMQGGLLVGDVETGQVRFLHHRLQEFLVARRLRLSDPPAIDWQDVLQSPRWQETLFNFFALGGYNAELLEIIIKELEPVYQYFEKLHPILETGEALETAAQERVDAIQPDEAHAAGEAGIYYTYSTKQRAKKDHAERRLAIVKQRNTRLRTIPINREMAWTDLALFTARLLAILQNDKAKKQLFTYFSQLFASLLLLGRPPAQVRMLSAWKEIPDRIDPEYLIPARQSAVKWVRTHAIHTISTIPISKNRVDFDFVSELRWEVLNLRLPAVFNVFWDVAADNRKYKLLTSMGMLSHTLIIIACLLSIIITGDQIVKTSPNVDFLSSTQLWISKWVLWFLAVGIGVILTLPAIRCPIVIRLSIGHTLVGGIIIGLLQFFYWDQVPVDHNFLFALIPESFEFLPLVIPGVLNTSLLLIIAGSTHLLFRWLKEHKAYNDLEGRQLFSSSAASIPLAILTWLLLMASVELLSYLFSLINFPSWVGITFGIVLIVVLGSIMILLLGALVVGHTKETWNQHKDKTSIQKIGIIVKSYFSFLSGIAIIIGAIIGFVMLLDTIKPIKMVSNIFFGLLILFMGLALLFFFSLLLNFLFNYTHKAFGITFSELRYLMFWRRIKENTFRGTLQEWEADFRNATFTRRKELLINFDHQAMGVDAREALQVLTQLESLIEKGSEVSELFYPKMNNIQETIRQQKWSKPK